MKCRKILVYVYGTLRKGHGNHRLLNEAKYKGKTELMNMAVYEQGLPYVVPALGFKLTVEKYLVDLDGLKQLDILEGHPDFYRRIKVYDKKGKLGWLYIEKTKWDMFTPYTFYKGLGRYVKEDYNVNNN